MGEIVTVNFRGDELYGFKQPDGIFVALKPMVEAMGLDWSAQLKRVKRDPILSEGMAMMATPFGRGDGQECACINVELIQGWLFTIDTLRIKLEEVRKKVQLYQRECYAVLHAHFTGKRPALAGADPDDEPTKTKTHVEKLAHVREVRQTFSTQAAREVYFLLGLEVTPSMLQPTQGELFSYTAIRRDEAAA